jgi:alpha-glucuronidase
MVNPGYHYGPNPDGYEYSHWGTYHYADRDGVGVDRTTGGTGFTGQYRSPLAERYETLGTCPTELLLFFHHVPYTHRLPDGRTLIQTIYDLRFDGADGAEELLRLWETLEGQVDAAVYERVHERLRHQTEHAAEWRDILNTYFFRKSGVPDAHGRPITP